MAIVILCIFALLVVQAAMLAYAQYCIILWLRQMETTLVSILLEIRDKGKR